MRIVFVLMVWGKVWFYKSLLLTKKSKIDYNGV